MPGCPLTTVSTVGTCPIGPPPFGYSTIRLVDNGTNDAAAVWFPPQRLGWGQMTIDVEMIVSKTTASVLPADGFALVIADGGSGTIGAVGGALAVPYTRRGLAIEWRFYSSDPNVDQVDTITVRRLTGSGSGTVLAGPVPVPSSQDFGSGDTMLQQNLVVAYTPDDPTTATDEERLVVRVAGSTLVNLTTTLATEIAAASLVDIGVTAATGGRVFRGDLRFGFELELCPDPPCGGTDYATNIEIFETCD